MKFVDLEKQYKDIQKETDRAINNVFRDSVFIGGKEVEAFEIEFAKFSETPYAVSLNSGTDALFLSLKALGVGPGDEVLTSPFTFIATAGTIINTGAKPVFVDIDPATFNIDTLLIEKAITKKTKAILPVHLFGHMADMEEIMRIARKYHLFVVEDAAQAAGARIRIKRGEWVPAGSMGDAGCFSFFPAKNLGAYGDGGMVTTRKRKLAETIRLLKNHGSSHKEKYYNLLVGTNSRLDSLQASILRVKLRHLKKWNKERAKKAAYYTQRLKGMELGMSTPTIQPWSTHIFHQYTLRVKQRDALRRFLDKKGIPTMVYYAIPLHLQPALKFLGHKKGDFLQAEHASTEVLSLPVYPELAKKDQDKIIRAMQEFYMK